MVLIIIVCPLGDASLKFIILFFPDDLIDLLSLHKGNKALIRVLDWIDVLLVSVPNVFDVAVCIIRLLEESINKVGVFFYWVLLFHNSLSVVKLRKIHSLAFVAAILFAVCRIVFVGSYLFYSVWLTCWFVSLHFHNLDSCLGKVEAILLT